MSLTTSLSKIPLFSIYARGDFNRIHSGNLCNYKPVSLYLSMGSWDPAIPYYAQVRLGMLLINRELAYYPMNA